METQHHQELSPQLFVGIDAHKRSWRIQLATDLFEGRSFSMNASSEELKVHIDKYYGDHQVHCAYEAGFSGYRAHRDFESFGWRSTVFNAADMARMGSAQHQKNDNIDARIICRELKDGRLRSVLIPDLQREHLRLLFRRRNSLVKSFRKVKTRIIAQLDYLGIDISPDVSGSAWSRRYVEWLGQVSFAYEPGRWAMESLLAEYQHLRLQLLGVNKRLRSYCGEHYTEHYKLLMSVPGIGMVVAAGILAELGDLRMYKNFKHLASYVGLMPRIYQSGDKQRSSGMTPRAKRIMRSYFIEASWQAIRLDPTMQAYFSGHKGKVSKKILVKVARKLLSRTHAVIRTGKPYELIRENTHNIHK